SQYAHRVHLALDEVKAEYVTHNIDLQAKPAWFLEKINPEGTIPALSYGPKCAPDDPSPEAAAIPESLVILEFLADLFPNGGILPPNDPVARARARLLVAHFESVFTVAFKSAFYEGKSPQLVLDALLEFQARLPKDGFALGAWGMVEMSAAPFLVRTWMLLEHDFG
ncbi:uncharacterized protein BXZ73DRAFT_18003, partial [Epithele typhae]